MKAAAAPRWAISFADLGLLLLGCFVMLHALRPASPSVAASAAEYGTTVELGASELFEPGEARLTEAGRAAIASVATAASGHRVEISSRGGEAAAGRLDAFELAAARTAAVARALGVDEGDVSASLDRAGAASARQRISVRIRR